MSSAKRKESASEVEQQSADKKERVEGKEAKAEPAEEDEWREVDGIEVNRKGEARNAKTKKPLNGCTGPGSRFRVVRIPGTGKIRPLGQLVCEAFHGKKPMPGHVLKHLDGDAYNDRASNLKWATRSEACTGNRGAVRAVVKVDAETAKDIATYASVETAATATGCCSSCISAVLNGRRITGGGYKWRLLDVDASSRRLSAETWKPVVLRDLDTGYTVSNAGCVKNGHTGRIMRLVERNGYFTVSLRVRGKKHTIPVHRLVANAFLANDKGLPCIDHIDEDKHNNDAKNLRWCTGRENATFARGRAVLQLSDEGAVIAEFDSISLAAESMGASKTSGDIGQCCRGKRRRAYGFRWQYKH